jgi:hypothetical protein
VFSTLPAASLISLVHHPGDSSQQGSLEPKFQQLLHTDLIASSVTALTKNMNGSIRAIVASHNTLSDLENTTFNSKTKLSENISQA